MCRWGELATRFSTVSAAPDQTGLVPSRRLRFPSPSQLPFPLDPVLACWPVLPASPDFFSSCLPPGTGVLEHLLPGLLPCCLPAAALGSCTPLLLLGFSLSLPHLLLSLSFSSFFSCLSDSLSVSLLLSLSLHCLYLSSCSSLSLCVQC